MPRHVMWLDPGKTTGWAMIHVDDDENPRFSADEGDFFHVCGVVDLHCKWYGSSLTVGYESYLGSGGTASYSHEVIGATRYITSRWDTRIICVPAAHRVIATNHVLKSLQWYQPGQGHANDATRHLVAWLLREGHWTRFPALHEVFTNLLR